MLNDLTEAEWAGRQAAIYEINRAIWDNIEDPDVVDVLHNVRAHIANPFIFLGCGTLDMFWGRN
jgi:hypothetical protein